ncbi:MAG: dephospho-CoA kinase [Saprospiraceae bacterium]|nr:dephospho-CoA kinase [Saprospiraceae bacterium]
MNPELPTSDSSVGVLRDPFPTLKVGITGGIGSGKTTVCKIFETLGIPVYYADERAKWLMVNDPDLIKDIKVLFGEAAYDLEGHLNRKYISDIVFNNPEKLNQLNSLVHPAVAKDGSAWNQAQVGVPYTLREAALIYEAGINKHLDYVIVVTAPLELRIQRVMQRDQIPREAVEARIDKQMPEEEKVRLGDFVIVNDGEQALIPQVLAIHQKLCKENRV